jgi:hypothetical protein
LSAAAEALGIHRKKLYAALHDGEIKGWRKANKAAPGKDGTPKDDAISTYLRSTNYPSILLHPRLLI